jgi:hypothetical protein
MARGLTMRFAIVLTLALSCAAPKPQETKSQEIRSTAPGALVVTVYLDGVARGGIDVEVLNGTAVAAGGKTNACGTVLVDALPDGSYGVTARQGDLVKTAGQVAIKTGADTNVRIDLPRPAASGKAAAGSKTCTPPGFIAGPNPSSSAEAIQQQRQGCLVVKCAIGFDGHVNACAAEEPLPGYTEDVIAVLQKRLYSPMICDGKPVETNYTYRLYFRLPR